MYTVDDSMLSLIFRFIGSKHPINYCNKTFIKQQIQEIQLYIEKYPEKEKQQRAIEWIEKYARQYRQSWETDIITKGLEQHRCSDCPITTNNSPHEHCQIHHQWKDLLEKYMSNEINSAEYVESTLELLKKNKNTLKIQEVEM